MVEEVVSGLQVEGSIVLCSLKARFSLLLFISSVLVHGSFFSFLVNIDGLNGKFRKI